MTALQELANLKGELDRIKADSDLNAQAFTDAQNVLASVTSERDALSAEKAALVSERDALAVKVTALEKASHDFTASVETRAAALATEQLAAVGAAPLAYAAKGTQSTDDIMAAYKSADARGKRELYLKHAALFNLR
jgi:peptidoglycan hydrolase CwlO-like protein